MGNKLYIGNLSFSVESEDLKELFGQEGTVESVNIITDRDTGRSKGFGFIVMSSDSEATACIEKFDGFEHMGRRLKVSEAKPEASRDGGGRRPSFGGDRPSNRGGGGQWGR